MTWFLDGLVRQRREEDISDGIKNMVVAYYEEYTEADKIDPDALSSFRAIETLCDELHVNVDLMEVVREAEAEVLRDTGRKVETFAEEED